MKWFAIIASLIFAALPSGAQTWPNPGPGHAPWVQSGMTPPVAAFSFDVPPGTPIMVDQTGNGHNINQCGSNGCPAYLQTGGRGGSGGYEYIQDGIGNRLDIDGSTLDLTSSGSYTIAIDIKFTSSVFGDTGAFLVHRQDQILAARDGTRNRFALRTNDPTYTTGVTAKGSLTLLDGSWHSLVFVMDGSVPNMKIYEDGALVGTSIGSSGTLYPNVYDIFLGSQSNLFEIQGVIDNVRIYNYALNLTQVGLINGVNVPNDISSPITAAASGSQTSGTAPFVVMFDAAGTTHTDSDVEPYTDLHYHWDFGDSVTGATWATTGESKDEDDSFLAVHAYTAAGSFTATLTVTDEAGNTDTETVAITVADPDDTFAGTATVCMSTSGDFTGCPTGAATATLSDFEASVEAAGDCDISGTTVTKRCLYRTGESFTIDNTFSYSNLNGLVHIASYGPPEDGQPTIDGVGLTDNAPAGVGEPMISLHPNGARNLTIYDVRLLGSNPVIASGERASAAHAVLTCSSGSGSPVENFTLYNVTQEDFSAGFNCNDADNDPVGLYGIDVTAVGSALRIGGAFKASRVALAGYTGDQLDINDSGVTRTFYANRFLFTHNSFGGSFRRNVNKFPGECASSTTSLITDTAISPWIVIRNNILDINGASSAGIAGGYNVDGLAGCAEFYYVVVENNQVASSGSGDLIEMGMTHGRISNNVLIDTSGKTSGQYAATTDSGNTYWTGGGFISDDILYANNVFYTAISGTAKPTAITNNSSATNIFAYGNLYFTPNSTAASDMTSGSVTASGNVETAVDVFVGTTFTTAADFVPNAGPNAVIGNGFDFHASEEDGIANYCDFAGNAVGTDAGAFELGASACP